MPYAIGTFSKLTDLSVDTLRYYEKEGIICPRRGANGRRVYSDEDKTWIDFIKKLKDTAMPIKKSGNMHA